MKAFDSYIFRKRCVGFWFSKSIPELHDLIISFLTNDRFEYKRVNTDSFAAIESTRTYSRFLYATEPNWLGWFSLVHKRADWPWEGRVNLNIHDVYNMLENLNKPRPKSVFNYLMSEEFLADYYKQKELEC